MSRTSIGIIDYGLGNHSSVIHCLRELGYRVGVSHQTDSLDQFDLLCLPGVGAFPAAIEALHNLQLVDYLQQQARQQRPILGICLGMQLLAEASYEHQYTTGLKLIPGEFRPMVGLKWHIGWNTLECLTPDPLLNINHGQVFYFNHSFGYQGPEEYQIGHTYTPERVVAMIRHLNVVGLQFHPEKSQAAGHHLLKYLIDGLTHA